MDTMGARVPVLAGFILLGLATVPFALAGPQTSEIWYWRPCSCAASA
jgi:hypothetical protein